MMKYFLSFALALMTIILFSQARQLNDHYLNGHYKNTIYLNISVLFVNIFIFFTRLYPDKFLLLLKHFEVLLQAAVDSSNLKNDDN